MPLANNCSALRTLRIGWEVSVRVRDHATRKEPRIRGIKVGKLLRFRREDIEDFLSNSIENVAQRGDA